jgi:hypothetical protein
VVSQTFSATKETINGMSDNLKALNDALNSGIALQTVVVSSQALQGVEELGTQRSCVY